MDCNRFWRDQHINYQPPIFILAHPLSEDSWNEVARKFLLAQFSKLSGKLQVNIIWTTQEHHSLQKRYKKICYQLHWPSHGTGCTLQWEQMKQEEKNSIEFLNKQVPRPSFSTAPSTWCSHLFIWSPACTSVLEFPTHWRTNSHWKRTLFFLFFPSHSPPGSLETWHGL